uniref:Uncharacterized protein n=1 Tax=Triticum urartu TaxID=4572 RepID=A0A8R7JW26_TRIUA
MNIIHACTTYRPCRWNLQPRRMHHRRGKKRSKTGGIDRLKQTIDHLSICGEQIDGWINHSSGGA